MDIRVRTGYSGEVAATVIQRRMLAGEECVLVEFSQTNRQWIPIDDRHLLLTDEQRKQIKYLPWYAGRKGL